MVRSPRGRRRAGRCRKADPVPIRPEYRWFYPIDWRQLSAVIRFQRAQGRCEGCGWPHGGLVLHLGDGRWWDAEHGIWRDGQGRRLRRRVLIPAEGLEGVRSTRVVLATAHRDHDPTNNRPGNLAALCQRCHLLHDRAEHQRRRWLGLFRRKALGDLMERTLAWISRCHRLARDYERHTCKAVASVPGGKL
jgi:hypothetical protein